VSVHDNFLDIGGHSLLAMRALARIAKKTGIRLGPSALNLQTLEQIASAIDGRLSPVERVESSPATVDAPPSKAPQGLVDRLFGAVRQTVSRT
jgi:hypothetical protein